MQDLVVRLCGGRAADPCNRETKLCQSEYSIDYTMPNLLSPYHLWKLNQLDLKLKWWIAHGALSAQYLQTILIPVYLSQDTNIDKLSHTAHSTNCTIA